MNSNNESYYREIIDGLSISGNRRYLKDNCNLDNLINLSGNDYLGIASDYSVQDKFMEWLKESESQFLMGSCSSRLLCANSRYYSFLENRLSDLSQKEAALLFNSGYHVNTGILPALVCRDSIIIADKLVHASLIDGIKLSGAEFERFKHNDIEHLKKILCKRANSFKKVFVVVESLYSMDGDFADIEAIIQLKKQYDNIILYVDEAHSVGVYGDTLMGYCSYKNLLDSVDILVGTFGKAFGSYGAFVLCSQTIKDVLINRCRSLIYSTIIPPITVMFNLFLLDNLEIMRSRQIHLQKKVGYFKHLGACSHIVPIVVGSSQNAMVASQTMIDQGFYLLPIRPPTVAEGSCRLRLSLSSSLSDESLFKLVKIIDNFYEDKYNR